MRYEPYGAERWTNAVASPTDFGFTSQRREGFGLYDYNARYYSPSLGRFVSPDTIVPEPGSSGGFNRYRYTRNNPLRYTDPSGHCVWDACIVESMAVYYVAAALVVAAGTVVVTSDPYQEMAQEAGGYIGNALADSFPLNGPTVEPLPGYGEGELEFNDPAQLPGTDLGGEFIGPLNLPSPGQVQEPTEIPGFSLDPGIDLPINSAKTKTPGIYEFPDLKNPGKTYVGQSGNIEGRLKQHEGRYVPGSVTTKSMPGSTKFEREVAEQNRINELGGIRGGSVSNQRNPIGPARREEAEKRGLNPFAY